jgi:hypothetical protein
MTRRPKAHDLQPVVCRITKTINIVAAEQEIRFAHRNHYRCQRDGTKWTDEWSCACNDKCPTCHAEIEPYLTENPM